MLEVGQDLHNLPQVLRVKPLDEGLANDVGQKLVQRLESHVRRKPSCHFPRGLTYLSERPVDDVGVVKVVLGELKKLFRKGPDVHATEGVHL